MNNRSTLILCSLASLLGVAALIGCGSSNSNNNKQVYTQFDRLARPAVNEVFATVANNEHQTNDQDTPSQDVNNLKPNIVFFMEHTAGRSAAVANTMAAVLVPDVMVADLTQGGQAAYLGVETGGATGGKFGGRKLTDDVVDISLGAIFGPTLTNAAGGLGLVADDGKEIATLTSDHVGPTTAPKHFQDGSAGFGAATFPYLGPPQ